MKFDQSMKRGGMPIYVGGGAACVALLLVGWLVGLGPLLDNSMQSTSALDKAEQLEREAQKSQSGFNQVAADLQRVKSKLERQPVNLKPAGQINTLLSELAELADGNKLAITKTRSGRPVALAYYDYVPITIAGEGGYTDLMAFLDALHRERGEIGVIAFDVQRLPTKEGARVRFDLELAWYVLSGDAPSPSTAAVGTD